MTHSHDHGDYEGPHSASLKRALEERETAQQEVLAQKHEIRRLFIELNQEHLSTLSNMLGVIVSTGEAAPVNAAHFHALSRVYLETRFGICMACEKNHDEAISEQLIRDQRTDGPTPLSERGTGVVPDPGYPAGIRREAHPEAVAPSTAPPDLKVGESGLLSVRQLANMQEYRLDDLRERDTNMLMGFICRGYPDRGLECGMPYSTIEDRMLKSPDDCSGCHQKAAHG